MRVEIVGNGPSRELWDGTGWSIGCNKSEDTDTIIASAGVAQADAETATLFGKEPQDLGYLRLAEQKELGSISSYSRKEISL